MAQPKYKSLRGMPDLLPQEADALRFIEEKAIGVFRKFGYREIKTPIMEETEVFTRSIGEDTDIVEKEMYSFEDRGGKSISLRPEGTASVIRAYIEHGWGNVADVTKLYYSGPMFRGERPQKGRQRQFYQIGAEIIGSSGPYIDAELILSLQDFLEELGIKGFTILLNSLGCDKDRASYKKVLSDHLSKKTDQLCDDCRKRSKTNILRVLDCKKESCRKVVKGLPGILESLCKECLADYEKLKKLLKEMKISFKEKKDLVRGLDYYTGTIFEVTHPALGAQDAIAAGGRYDSLTREMGGPSVGATGYAVGVERLILALDKKVIPGYDAGVLVVTVSDEVQGEAFTLAERLRKEGIVSGVDLTNRSFKGQMRKADREKRKYVVIIGEDELKTGKVLLKDMLQGEQESLSVEELIKKLKEKRA